MKWKTHNKFIEKFYLLNEEDSTYDKIHQVVIKVKIDKSETDNESIITTLLTDIRSITRVTIVSSIDSIVKSGIKYVLIRIKFNSKNLSYEGYLNPQDYVDKTLIPTIQTLDSKPRILDVSRVQDAKKKQRRA